MILRAKHVSDGASAITADLDAFEKFIANSTQGSQTSELALT
jgi:hypothetical protein